MAKYESNGAAFEEENSKDHNGGEESKENGREGTESDANGMSSNGTERANDVQEPGSFEYFVGPAQNQSLRSIQYLARYRNRNGLRFFPYFALPRELRDLVMDYILVPEKVHPKGARFYFGSTKTKGGRRSKTPGVQFLATCRQAYIEGHKLFYQQNTFFIAPGFIEDSGRYFDELTPYHKGLIKSVHMTINCHDSTKDALDFVGIEVYDYQVANGGSLDYRSIAEKSEVFLRFAQFKLDRIWDERLDWISRWRKLSHLTLDFRVGTCSWHCAREIRNTVERCGQLGWNHPDKLTILTESATRELEYRIILGGWETVGICGVTPLWEEDD
ncbi:MAG: hypothetical protein M1830_010641 [Pleopsidium flavum]|nr:MAG: hypothetical protein M1830_010641 [Pleopsidium flavum]